MIKYGGLYLPPSLMINLIKIIPIVWAFSALAWTRFEAFPQANFQASKREKCVFFHPWASWCEPCLKELPEIVSWLNGEKRVTALVLDLSTPFVQESFSKSFMRNLKPQFLTYLRPDSIDEKNYINAWSQDWQGELPYSELYVRGSRKKVWKGRVKLKELRREVAALCK